MELTSLIKRCEDATATNQHIVLEEAIKYADRRKWINRETALQALAWIEAGAFIDAALTLVPEGMEFDITNIYGAARVAMGLNAGEEGPWYADRADGNLALTICIAALRTRSELPEREEG